MTVMADPGAGPAGAPESPRPAHQPPVKVLWLVKGLWLGGAQRLVAGMARELDRGRFHMELAYVMEGQDSLEPELRALGLTVHPLAARHDLDLRWVPRLRRLISSGGFEIVHTHSPLTAAVVRTAVWSAPHVYTEHNVWPAYRPATRFLNAATFRRNAAAIAVSNGVADVVAASRLASGSHRALRVIYHGVDEAAIERGSEARATGRRALGLSDDDFVLGMVAGLRPEKNPGLLLAALGDVVRFEPRARLVLMGGGPLEPALRQQAAQDGLVDRVRFAGLRDDVQALLPAFDVFVLSSDVEGLPIALLEAMAAGVPAVATAVGGTPEAMTDGREGFLVPPRDRAAMVAAILRLRDPDLRAALGAAGSRRAEDFSLERATRQTESLYLSVLGRG